MKLLSLTARRFRSLREVTIPLNNLNLFIGANASGKSSILDALRFVQEAIQARDFREPVSARGGSAHLAWKGETANQVWLELCFDDEGITYNWRIRLYVKWVEATAREVVTREFPNASPQELLVSDEGTGWWYSGDGQKVKLQQSPSACALAAASADAAFPARRLAEFVGSWGFFDPSPFSLRRAWPGVETSRLDAYGRNLAERLFALKSALPPVFSQIVSATQSILGLPTTLEPRESEGRYYFVQEEPGLKHPVHQLGTSSGTLRILALMTALFEESGSSLIGIEEPENHVHPSALNAFAQYLLMARAKQILVTTHSPLLLDDLNEPGAVCVVRRDEYGGTLVTREGNPDAIRTALKESGFGLGEYYETQGFGS